MAKDLNKVQLTGRLGAEPEMRYSPQGSPIVTFRVASNRQWKDQSGETKEDTEWFSIVAWNKLAEICNQYLKKGTRVYIEGRSQTRSWEDAQTGQTRFKTEIIANDMIILDGANQNAAQDNGEAQSNEWTPPPAPTGRGTARGAMERRNASNVTPPTPPTGRTINYEQPDIGEDDLPF